MTPQARIRRPAKLTPASSQSPAQTARARSTAQQTTTKRVPRAWTGTEWSDFLNGICNVSLINKLGHFLLLNIFCLTENWYWKYFLWESFVTSNIKMSGSYIHKISLAGRHSIWHTLCDKMIITNLLVCPMRNNIVEACRLDQTFFHYLCWLS